MPREKDLFLSIKFKEILNALSQDDQTKGLLITYRPEVGIRWESPLEGWVALNIDGAARGNPGPAGADRVIRGDRESG